VYGGDGKVKILSKVLTAFQIEKLKNLLNELRQSKGESDFENKLMKLDHLLREYGFLSGEMSLKMILEEREKLLNQRWGDFKRGTLKKYSLLSGMLRRAFKEIEDEANIDDDCTLKEVEEKLNAENSVVQETASAVDDGEQHLIRFACLFAFGNGYGGFCLSLPPILPLVSPIVAGLVVDVWDLRGVMDGAVFSTWGINGYKGIRGRGGAGAIYLIGGAVGIGITIVLFSFWLGVAPFVVAIPVMDSYVTSNLS